MKGPLVGIALLVVATTASAIDVVVPVGNMAVLNNGAGAARVVFRPGAIELPENIAIGKATLSFSLPSIGEAKAVRVRLHPVTTAWTAGLVTWSAGWSQPGGDFDLDLAADTEIIIGAGGQASFDVTGILQEIEAGYFADGFILTVPQEEGIGLNVSDLPAFAAVGSATVNVFYRSISERQID